MNNYIPAYNVDLLPVLIALVLLSTVMLWIAIKNYKNLMAMMIIIPLTIFSGWTIYTTIDKLLGYPVVENFTEDSIYLFHTEGVDNKWMFVWIFKPTDTRPKAIMVPNSKNNQDAMAEAKERSEGGGIPQVIRSKDNAAGQTQGGELERYDFQMQNIQNLKDNEPEDNNTSHIRNPTVPTKQPSNARPSQGLEYIGQGLEYIGQGSDGVSLGELTNQDLQYRVIIPSGK